MESTKKVLVAVVVFVLSLMVSTMKTTSVETVPLAFPLEEAVAVEYDEDENDFAAVPVESVSFDDADQFPEANQQDDVPVDEDKIPNFYRDRFTTYDCTDRFSTPGSYPRFMVLGVHKGGSTAMYNYLAKHGRVRPAVCKEIHFFDKLSMLARGRGFYLHHFPDVSKWQGKVITGEGSPDYIRIPHIPQRVKSMFPNVRFLVTLREPSTRFESHWVGARENQIGPLKHMGCERAWNYSLAKLEACYSKQRLMLQTNDTAAKFACERQYHENAIVRGLYQFQLLQWLDHFPASQIMVVQAESVFNDPASILQKVVRFLQLRPYTSHELNTFNNTNEGSSHMSEPLANRCRHLKERMDEFYASHNQELKKLLQSQFPSSLEDWVDGWSGM